MRHLSNLSITEKEICNLGYSIGKIKKGLRELLKHEISNLRNCSESSNFEKIIQDFENRKNIASSFNVDRLDYYNDLFYGYLKEKFDYIPKK